MLFVWKTKAQSKSTPTLGLSSTALMKYSIQPVHVTNLALSSIIRKRYTTPSRETVTRLFD
jgi:hypothetical protein